MKLCYSLHACDLASFMDGIFQVGKLEMLENQVEEDEKAVQMDIEKVIVTHRPAIDAAGAPLPALRLHEVGGSLSGSEGGAGDDDVIEADVQVSAQVRSPSHLVPHSNHSSTHTFFFFSFPPPQPSHLHPYLLSTLLLRLLWATPKMI